MGHCGCGVCSCLLRWCLPSLFVPTLSWQARKGQLSKVTTSALQMMEDLEQLKVPLCPQHAYARKPKNT